MSGAITSFFFNPKVANTVATLYNDNSMWPLFIRDITLDVPGRLYQASRRDGFGNEEFVEQAIEQGGTSFIWGLGVPTLRAMFDRIALNTDKLPKPLQRLFSNFKPVQYTDISTELLPVGAKPPSALSKFFTALFSPVNQVFNWIGRLFAKKPDPNIPVIERGNYQSLNYNRIQRLAKRQKATIQNWADTKQVDQAVAETLQKAATKRQHHLTEFFDSATKKINDKGLLKNYNQLGNTKFVVASVIPAFLIAIGIPLIFQYVTRKTIDQKKAAQHASQSDKDQIALQLAVMQNLQQQQVAGNVGSAEMPPTANPNGHVNFSGLGGILTMMRNSDKWNTLLVDGVISGGRVAIARNIYDSLENLIQEVGTIYFLFFAMAPLQRIYGRLVDKLFGTFTRMPIEVAKPLFDLKQQQGMPAMLDKLEGFRKTFMKAGLLDTVKGKQQKANALATFEKAVFEKHQLEEYLLAGKSDNFLFEMGKAIGAIDMVDPTATTVKKPNVFKRFGAWVMGRKLPKPTSVAGGPQLWNYSKAIDVKALYQLGQGLQAIVERAQAKAGLGGQQSLATMGEKTAKWFGKRLSRTGPGLFGAWMMAALTSSAFLAWGVPRFKQKVTEWLTGHDKFPGKFNDGRRTGILNADVTIHA